MQGMTQNTSVFRPGNRAAEALRPLRLVPDYVQTAEGSVLIEMGNMKNPADAALEEDPAFRQQAAVALADGLSTYLLGH